MHETTVAFNAVLAVVRPRLGALAGGLVLVCLGLGGAAAQVPTAGTRDTVVVVRRDTLVILQRDTVFVREVPTRVREAPPGPMSPEERRDALEQARLDRRARLEELRRAREARFASLPEVRGADRAVAVALYPTRLLEIDFPALTAGVTVVKDGRYGLMASAGALVRPLSGNRDIPEGRAPVRGFDLGVEGRYYASPLYKEFAMYFAVGTSVSVAPVRYTRYVPVASGSYDRLQEADATGRRVRFDALIGWELRSGGIVVDLTTGLEFNFRGVFTDDEALARAIDREFFNLTEANRYNPQLVPVVRVGIGMGKW